jgi:SAM-dependent methyltransferase
MAAPTTSDRWWTATGYELRERAYAPIHDRLVQRLGPRPGERVLDVGCGLGEVAARAARTGAAVTGVDLAEGMIERARRRPEAVDWRVANCEALPFADDSFDAVVSSFGVIFARDPGRAAAELARVCRGRIALTAWIGEPGRDLWKGCPPAPGPAREWSTPAGLATLLPSVDLDCEEGVWWLRGHDAEALWEWHVRSSPVTRGRLGSLSPARAAEVRDAWIERYEQFRVEGTILVPHMYLLALASPLRPRARARGRRSSR